jgi:pSer/pThr/pTyr-binding forkhead associated (FHA) protein
MIKLVISDNEGTTTVVPLARDEVSIGRKEGNTIRLTERNISREHCQLQRHNGSFVLRDLSSYNGVLVNGQRVVGELALKAGDELRIGDYTMLLEAEKPAAADSDAEPTRVAPVPQPTPPARLVVLSEPLAGAEFSLPEKGELRLGRAPELDIALDHRSVSREHAKIACEGGQARIIDQSSINGVVVNHQKVTDARLAPGDVIELGDVLLRFVGAGEQYVFDPDEARRLSAPKRAAARRSPALAVGIVVAAAIVALVIVRSGQKPSLAPPRAPVVAKAADEGSAAPSPESAPVAAEVDRFGEMLDACQKANEAGRYAEAVAHANAALKSRPDAADALDCRQTARINNEQEQIYVRAKAALAAGDGESAWKELSALSPQSAVARRPEVLEALASAARSRLSQAQSLLRKHAEQAAEVAGGVLAVGSVPELLRAEAQALVDKALGVHSAKAARVEVAQRAPAAPRAATAERPKPMPVAPRAVVSEKASAMEAASACLARGDNACVIRALNGKAQTAQELGLLIETYRAVGESAQAARNMATYVQRFPTARRAEAYRQMLERQGH